MSLHLCRQAPLRLAVAAIFVITCAALAPAADQTATWNNSTGNWSDPTRWSTNPLFPNNGNGGFTYDAIINAGTVTLDLDVTIEALNLTNGTLTSAAATNFALTLNDLFTWTGGTIGGPGTVIANDGITMSGTTGKQLGSGSNTGRTLVNNGVANLSGGTLNIGASGGAGTVPSSLFQNNGTFNATDEADISNLNFGGPAGRFNNAGTFNKSGVGTTTDISAIFTNSGTVNVDQGTLQLSGGGTSTGGTIAVDAGATLRFSGGNHTLENASTITGAGDVAFTAGTVTLEGAYTVTGITTVVGTANFNTPSATLTTLNVSGTLGGSGSQNITTAFNWTAGTMAGAATTTVDATATLNLSGTTGKQLGSGSNTGRTLVNNGVANLSGGTLNIGASGGAGTVPSSLFQNNGTFNATDEADISNLNFGGPAGRFNNAGTFNKSGVGTTTDISAIFTNSGTVNVDQGTLQLSGGGTSTGGTIAVDAGATLRFSGGNHTLENASTITGAGDVAFTAGTVTLEGAYTVTGITTVVGTANFNTPSATLTTLNVSGTLGGSGSQNITTAFNWTAGTMAGAATTTVDATATLNLSGTTGKQLGSGSNTGRTLVNNGVANLSGGTLNIGASGGAGTVPSSLFQNNGTFNATDEADISNLNFGGPAGTFNNAGTFNKSGVGTTTDISTVFSNSGTINVNEGILLVSGPFTNYDAATDTLTGGTYNVTSTFRFGNADINTNRASITLNGPASQITAAATNALADFSLNDTGAFFGITNNRDFTTTAAFTNRGEVQIGGGIFNAASITNEAAGEFFGFGAIADAIVNSGIVRAAGGTLTTGGTIAGPAGTIQIDAGASLDIAGSGGDSNADFLVHNGDGLSLGANDVSVRDDYSNANFGVGNSFNHRVNVTGTGEILADDPFTISASGDVTGGSTIDFGNHRVGAVVNRSYQVNHNGTSGASPQVRTAIQTSVNGGNITDARLGGAGLTASNLAPIASGTNSGPLGVTFNASSAGALVGQSVHIEDNFDNVVGLTLGLTGAAYNPAVANVAPVNVNFGNFHVGDPVTAQSITIGNTAPAGLFSEDLRASNFVASPDALIAAGSPSSVQVVAGGANNTLGVSISTASAGARTGSITMDLTSTGQVGDTPISGLAPLGLGQRTINVSANVFRFAAPVVSDLNLGEFHVGAPAQGNINVENTATADGFSESLRATVTGFAPAVTAAAGSADVAPGASNSSALSATLSTANAGMISGTVDVGLTSLAGAAGLTSTPLATQQADVRASVFRFAEPVIQNPQPIDFGILHVGDAVAQVPLSILNNAAADGFSENLNASFGPVEVGVTTNGGAITGLAPQASNAASMTVGIDTSAALVIDRTAFVEFQSDGAGINSLGQTDLPISVVQVTGQVNNFAVADLAKLAGDGTFSMTGPSEFTLNLGSAIMGEPALQAELGVINDVLAPADDLAGSFTLAAPDFTLTGFDPFTGLAAGSTRGGLMVELDTSMVGAFSGQITLNPRSTNPRPFSMDLSPITIRLLGEVQPIPEPATITLLIALLAFAALRRR